MTDTEWQQLMAQSPEKGRRALIDQYSGLVYAIVYSKLQGLGSREDVEDCVSDVFVKLFRSAEGLYQRHRKTYGGGCFPTALLPAEPHSFHRGGNHAARIR